MRTMNFTYLKQNITKIAWQGERVCIQTDRDIKGVITDDSGNTIPIKVEGLYATIAKNEKVWDVIAPYKPEGTDKLWLTINIPHTARPGFYTNSYITIQVLPIALPPRHEWKFHLDLWQNPWAVARYHNVAVWSDKHFTLLDKHLRLLADAGQKVVTTTVVDDVWASQTYDSNGSMVSWYQSVDGSLSFDFSVFVKYVKCCETAGITGPIHIFSILPWGSNQGCGSKDGEAAYTVNDGAVKIKAAPGSQTYYELWRPFMSEFSGILQENGWVDRVHFAFDERHEDEMMEALKMLNTVLPDILKPIKTASAYEYNEKYTDSITDLSPGFNPDVNWNKISDERRAKGQKTTFYLCEWPKPPSANNFLCSPEHESKWVGWYAAANGLDGFLRWAFDSWPKEPLLCGDFPGPHGHWPAGDTFLCYPNGWGSRRLAMLREGIQDYEKLKILKARCGSHVDSILSPFIHSSIVPLKMMQTAQDQLNTLTKKVCGITSFYILRHGDRFDHAHSNVWKDRVKYLNHTSHDPPLTYNGHLQAREVGNYLKNNNIQIDNVYCSPYLRTVQTATEISQVLNTFLKLEGGLSEGWHKNVMSHEERACSFPYIDIGYSSAVVPVDNEPYNEFMPRVKMFADHIKHSGGSVLLVSHAATSLGVAACLLECDPKKLGKIGACEMIRLDRFVDGKFHLASKTTVHSISSKTKPWGF